MATLGAGSPASSGSQAGAPHDRTAAKAVVNAKAKQLAEAVALITYLDEATRTIPRGHALQVPIQTKDGPQIFLYGRKEFKEFVKMIESQIKILPRESFEASKTHREVASGSGFDAPQIFRQDIVNFFVNATLGPQVAASPTVDPDSGKIVPDERTLRPLPNTRLNDALYFTRQNIGQVANPLYRIVSHGILTPLFALHVHYAGGQNPDQAKYISATQQMRQQLRDVMVLTIQKDVQKFSEKYPQNAQQIAQLGQNMVNAIGNPSASNNGQVGPDDNMFNPNAFPFAHFSKIISAGKEPKEVQTDLKLRLIQSAPQIIQAYQQLPEFSQIGTKGEAAAATVIETQKFAVASARAAKNLEKAEQQKVRRAEQNRIKRAQNAQNALAAQQQAFAQVQAGMGGLPGQASGYPMMGGLPNVAGLPTVPQ